MSIVSKMLEDHAETTYQKAQSYFGERKTEIEAGLAHGLTSEERLFMKRLYGCMPVSDIANYDFVVYLNFVRHAIYVREHTTWGKNIPEDIFFDYVLYPRVNNEDIEDCRSLFFKQIYPRLEKSEKISSMVQAALEANIWCYENATYRTTDTRTASPLTVLNCAYGRCGEESTFAVTALRSVGIPARQIYTPSWPHCDDNHAWVEVWCDGKWHYIGACEPEPVLDKGWFTTAASRAMLIHSRSFSQLENKDEEVVAKDGAVTLYNQLSRYADTCLFTITVESEGKPLEGARLQLELLNYAQFAPLATLYTDQNGQATITLGIGEIHIHCVKDGYYTASMADLRTENHIKLDFGKAVAQQSNTIWPEDFNMTPPKDNLNFSISLTAEQQAQQRECTAMASELLHRKEASYFTQLEARERAKALELEDEEQQDIVAQAIVDARGNAHQVEAFLQMGANDQALRIKLLSTLSQKDKTDMRALVLEDHISAAQYDSMMSEELFTNYVLCPHIALERITPWRKEIESYFSTEDKQHFRAKPATIWDWICANIQEIPQREYKALITNPAQLLHGGWGSETSKKLLFVAICRTLGIPARLNPENEIPQYYKWDCFHNVPKQEGKETLPLVILNDDETKWEYTNNWTLAVLQDGLYQTLDLSQRVWDGVRLELQVLSGFYRLITVKRMPNGSVFAREYRFPVERKKNKITAVKISLRNARISDMLENMELPEFLLLTQSDLQGCEKAGTMNRISVTALTQSQAAAKGNILIWLEEGKEPTEHILNELMDKKDQLSAMEIQLVFILRNSQALENYTLNKAMNLLPKAVVCYDEFADIAPVIARRMYVDPEKLPLVVVTRPGRNAIYACSGYNVGTGEMLVKILSEESLD